MATGAKVNDGRLIGPHMPVEGGLLKAGHRAQAIGATAIQIFTDNPTAWRRREHAPDNLPDFRRLLDEAGIGWLAVHAPYLINLCGPDEDFWQKSVATLANELRVGGLYGAAFVVFHIGSHRGIGRDAGIERLVGGMARALAESEPEDGSRAPKLVLENAAGTGDGIGASLEDLADILEAAARAGLAMDRMGICLDTAHLWAAGYDVGSEHGVAELVGRVDDLLGRERVVMVHLNDSRTTRGSRLDRHEHIGAGQQGPNGMAGLLHDPWMASLPTYLETPGMDSGYDQVNLERTRLVIAREQLPELPPEAFTLRGSRSRSAAPTN